MTRLQSTPERGPANPTAPSPDPIAYRNCPRPLTPAGGGNLTLTALTYTADPWGRGWYVSATPSLLNAGSRTAAAAGLYHYTTQTNQTKEANTPVDIGFHYVAASTSTGRPVDTDGDGLPDYFEDLNGNGAADPGETNPEKLDSLGDGLPDSVRNAPTPTTYVSRYLLDATRDFTLFGRSAEYPDAFVLMGWHHHQPSRLFKWGDARELYGGQTPPPDTLLAEGDEWNWPSVGAGGRRHFQTTQAAPNTQVWGPSVPSDRPPSPEVLVLEEHCAVSVPNPNPMGGSYTRSARSWTSLKTEVHHWPKSTRSVVLEVIADQVDAAAELSPWAWNAAYNLPEPCAAQGGVPIDPVVSEILVRGRRVNPDGKVLLEVPCQPDSDVTPQVTPPPSWMKYVLSAGPAKPITMTWSIHPDAGDPPDLQALFDEAARELANDRDGQLEGDDEVKDSVPIYLEFFIPRAKHAVFPAEYGHQFNDIYNGWDLHRLVVGKTAEYSPPLWYYRFANIKVVRLIWPQDLPPVPGTPYCGYAARSPTDPSDLAFYPSIVISVACCNPRALAHELGHVVGLEHRGHPQLNPGNPNDPQALMFGCNALEGGWEINSWEAAFFYGFTSQIWNESEPSPFSP